MHHQFGRAKIDPITGREICDDCWNGKHCRVKVPVLPEMPGNRCRCLCTDVVLTTTKKKHLPKGIKTPNNKVRKTGS